MKPCSVIATFQAKLSRLSKQCKATFTAVYMGELYQALNASLTVPFFFKKKAALRLLCHSLGAIMPYQKSIFSDT
jgi:hypothetical protein